MKQEVFLRIILDTRYKLKDGTYPVKLSVYTKNPVKQKRFSTKFKMTEKEFDSVWNTQKPLNKFKDRRRELQNLLDRADDIVKLMEHFTHEEFEKRMNSENGASQDIFHYYNEKIENLKKLGRYNTAENYSSSLRSIKEFIKLEKNRVPKQLYFKEISPDFLARYEYFMVEDKNRSQTTVGIYLRPLRAIFNIGKTLKVVNDEIYPFKKGLYQIPSPSKFKKSLNKEQLKTLYEAVPETPMQELARDYWFFLYNASGMNIKDMALLRYKNLFDDKIVYVREKTKQTAKTNSKPIVVFLNEYLRGFIDLYALGENNSDSLVFDIIENDMSLSEQRIAIKNFTRFLNTQIKKLAIANGLPESISSYWSRHSFATNAIRKGASLEQMQQALNHKDMATTLNYFAGFEDDDMREIADNLMDFNS